MLITPQVWELPLVLKVPFLRHFSLCWASEILAGWMDCPPSSGCSSGCCSVAQSCPTLCNPMDCSTPGFPVLHNLPEFAQTPVHWVSDAIQPSHPLSSPSPPPSVFASIRVFSSESVLPIRWPKYWSFSFSISPSSEYSRLISFRIDWFDLLAAQGTLKSPPVPPFESILGVLLFSQTQSYLVQNYHQQVSSYWAQDKTGFFNKLTSLYLFSLAVLWSMKNISSQNRDWTDAPCIGNMES